MMHFNKRKGFQTDKVKIRRGVDIFYAYLNGYLARILAAVIDMRCHWLARTSLALLLLCYWQPHQADGLSEGQIKAAYLYNFAKFVEWPAEALPAGSEILLCVVGNNVLDGALETLSGRNIGERRLRVMQQNYANLSVSGCHLLFIGNSEQQHFLVILKALGSEPTLTLSDIEDFAAKGGGIGLLFRDDRVVFEVNLEPIRQARLHLPGQLLNIASKVYGR